MPDSAHLLGVTLALFVGLSLGILGGGGSILAVPIFIYVLGIPPKPAIAMSLAVVGATSFAGFLAHWRQRNVDLGVAWIFALFAVAGAFTGARLARLIPAPVQLALFGGFALTAAWFMYRSGSRDLSRGRDLGATTVREPAGDAGARGDRPHPMLLAAVGIAVGVFTAIIGAGGGFMIVPALVLLARVPMRAAVGTSLLILTANALSGFAGYLGQLPIDWSLLVWFTGVAIVGIVMGSAVVRHVPQPRLKQAFSMMVVVLGAYIVVRTVSRGH
jgi:uncharacterized protein